MSDNKVGTPAAASAAQGAPAPPVAPVETGQEPTVKNNMTPNQKLSNKFAVHDEVWAVVALGPDVKVGKYPIRGMNAEFLGTKWKYMYHLPVASDGHADAVNMTIVEERLMSYDREEVEKMAHTAVKDIYKEYEDHIAKLTEEYTTQMADSKNKFERMIAQLIEESEKCNADDLVIQPREVKPEANAAVADKISSAPTGQNKVEDPVDPDADCLICSMKPEQCVCNKANPPANEPERTSPEGAPKSESAKSEEEGSKKSDGGTSPDSEQPA